MKLSFFLPAAAMLLLLSISPLSAQTELHCETLPLPHDALRWASTFVSVSDTDTRGVVLAVDSSTKTLIQINTGTGTLKKHTDGKTVTATRSGHTVVLEQIGGKLEAINSTLQQVGVGERLSATGPNSIYSGWTSDGTRFLGFGSIRGVRGQASDLNPNDVRRNFRLGFIFGKISQDPLKLHAAHLLRPVEENSYYLLGSQYFTSNLDGLFLADMTKEGKGSIWRVADGDGGTPHLVQILSAPSGYEGIEAFRNTDDTRLLFKQLESFSGVAGLVAYAHTIYVVTRNPSTNFEGVEWRVYPVITDGSEYGYGSYFILPTSAAHILLASDIENLYVLEKMEVTSWGNQEITSVMTCAHP